MRILGIDPGTGRTGFGVIDLDGIASKALVAAKTTVKKTKKTAEPEESILTGLTAKLITFGCIETPKEDPMTTRLVTIRKAIKDLLATYKPDHLSIELLFFGVNSRTAMTVGQARGVILEATASEDVPIYEYQGLMIKRLLSGSGKADKKEMQEKVRSFFNLEAVPKPDDAADGVAIALCHAAHVSFAP